MVFGTLLFAGICTHKIFCLLWNESFYIPPPLNTGWGSGGGGYIGITLSICLCVPCRSVCVSDCVRSISAELLSHFLKPDFVWWCIIMSRCVMQKNWFTIFNVKVTARANIIKIWLVLQYFTKLLVGLQPKMVWTYNIISLSVLWKILITAFKVKVTARIQNVSECLSGWYLLNRRTFCYQTWYCDAASWARVSCTKEFSLSSRSRSRALVW